MHRHVLRPAFVSRRKLKRPPSKLFHSDSYSNWSITINQTKSTAQQENKHWNAYTSLKEKNTSCLSKFDYKNWSNFISIKQNIVSIIFLYLFIFINKSEHKLWWASFFVCTHSSLLLCGHGWINYAEQNKKCAYFREHKLRFSCFAINYVSIFSVSRVTQPRRIKYWYIYTIFRVEYMAAYLQFMHLLRS